MPFSGNPARRSLALALLLVAAIVAAYAHTLRGDFLWDDDLHITANPTIVGPLGLKEIWTSARANYFPLVLTNFKLQHALWGLDPFGYRVVTLGFHVGAALLLWAVLRQLRIPGAWLGAALWALHPVQVESVAWICELKNTQSAVFFLAALWAYVRWLDGPPGAAAVSAPSVRSRFYALALGFAVLAILSKPSTVMLPVALALCAWWRRGRVLRTDVVPLAPFFLLSALAAGWTIWEQKFNSGAIGPEWNQTLPERFAIAGRVIWFYLGKLVWPEPLIFIYPRWEISGADPAAYLGLAGVLVAAGFLVWRGRRGPLRAVAWAAASFVALLFPVLGFFSVFFFRYSFVGDHFQYLASMGPLALAGAALAHFSPRLLPWLGGAALAALAVATAQHGRVFLSNEVLWRHTVARNPAAIMAWLNLGDTLAKAQRHDEAIATFRHALTLRPTDPYGWNDLGCELVLVGRPAEALPALERAVALKAPFPEAQNNLGNALRDLGRTADAIARYREAIALQPRYAEAHDNLGTLLAQSGRAEEALPHFETALSLRPGHAPTEDNYGSTLRRLGRIDEAIARHEAALRRDPRLASAHANLGLAEMARRRPAAAVPHFERAIALRPDLAAARAQLALALSALGRTDEALAQLQAAVRAAPGSAEAHANLGVAHAQAGRLAEAEPLFRRAVELDPEFALARLNYGAALCARQDWPAAVPHLEAAIRLQPDSLAARTQLAVALVNSQRLEAAVPHFEAGLRLAPADAALRENFAQVLRALGRNREAFDQLEEAARLRRESPRR